VNCAYPHISSYKNQNVSGVDLISVFRGKLYEEIPTLLSPYVEVQVPWTRIWS
jgi:hypothetical protein